MKVVINSCFGGYGLSDQAKAWLKEHGCAALDQLEHERHNPLLVELVETMGSAAGGEYSRLKVVEIPDGVAYAIDEYDGAETIHECHRSWR